MQPAARITDTEPPDEPVPELVWDGMPYPLLLDVSSLKLTDQQLEQISADNGNLQLELTAKGELVVLPPTGDPDSFREARLTTRVDNWAMQDGSGITSGPSGGFRLPNGAVYAPDVSWVLGERLEAWRNDQEDSFEGSRGGFPGLCPDFVLELRSRSDTLASLQRIMEEYLENGARLGWLVDPINRRVHVYRPGEPVEIVENPETISGDPVLPGFELDLNEIW